MGVLVPVESGEVGNALDIPARLSASIPDGVDPVAKNVEVRLIDVPISVVLGDVLLAYLDCKPMDNEVMQGDWLVDGNSSTNIEAGEEIDVQEVDSRDNFDLNIIQIAEDAFFKMIGQKKPFLTACLIGNSDSFLYPVQAASELAIPYLSLKFYKQESMKKPDRNKVIDLIDCHMNMLYNIIWKAQFFGIADMGLLYANCINQE
ncbi:hypothetical protein M5K25_017082 [Dendrobium thyrsiflorum]|uniref:Uncharacterized protein n=1 Tax=Dendrobium thyrsiflorum TaxID=117978 RepID=A0ABD0ULH2_DENTH